MRGRQTASRLINLLALIAATTLVFSHPQCAGAATDDFAFYAVYDRLADTDGLKISITLAALSADGTTLAFAGQEPAKKTPVLFTVKADGSELTQVALPNLDGRGIGGLAISQDGSRVFFTTAAPYKSMQLYRAEGGSSARILDAVDPNPDLAGIQQVQCTADGRLVFFLESGGYNGDVWSVRDDGGGLRRVVDDIKVDHSRAQGGAGYNVAEFAISADGGAIAFILTGYFDKDNSMVRHTAPEVFVAGPGGGARQLTDQAPPVAKSQLRISGDGSTIVYMALSKPWRWHAIAGDGGSAKPLDQAAANFGGAGLTFDGRLLFYVDGLANGGRLVDTRSGAHLDVFPVWNRADIALVANSSAAIDRDGDTVAFIFTYSEWPFKQALYAGHFMQPDGVADAPVIEDVAFVPGAMPPNDPKARVTLAARISDPDGLSDIVRTSTDELLAGILEGNTTKVPLHFGPVKDDGRPPDPTAGDGAFTAEGKPGGKTGQISQMTVRTGVMDRSNTVVVADVVFPPGTPALPSPADLIPQDVAATDASGQPIVRLRDGDARDLAVPPSVIAYANAEYTTPPAGVSARDSGGLWRSKEWISLTEPGQWIEVSTAGDATAAVVQFWGDANDGWARVWVDGQEVWTGDTHGTDGKWPGGAFVKHVGVSGLAPGPHTVRVENMGRSGGKGDDVTVLLVGFY